MAEVNHISLYKGEAVDLIFTMTPVVDITGWTLTFTLRNNQTDAVALLTITPLVLTTPISGVFTCSLTHAQTNIAAATYAYDIQRIDSGAESVLSIGDFIIKQEVLY